MAYTFALSSKDISIFEEGSSAGYTFTKVEKGQPSAMLGGVLGEKLEGRFNVKRNTAAYDSNGVDNSDDHNIIFKNDGTYEWKNGHYGASTGTYEIESNSLKLVGDSEQKYLFELSKDGTELLFNGTFYCKDDSFVDKTAGSLKITERWTEDSGRTYKKDIIHGNDGCHYVLSTMFGTEDLKNEIAYWGDGSVDGISCCIFDRLTDDVDDKYLWVSNTEPYTVWWGGINADATVIWVDGDGRFFGEDEHFEEASPLIEVYGDVIIDDNAQVLSDSCETNIYQYNESIADLACGIITVVTIMPDADIDLSETANMYADSSNLTESDGVLVIDVTHKSYNVLCGGILYDFFCQQPESFIYDCLDEGIQNERYDEAVENFFCQVCERLAQ